MTQMVNILVYAVTFGSAHFWKKMSDWASKYFKQFYTRISKMFISYDSGKCPIMWKLYLAYLVNFAEEAGLVDFASQGDLSGQKIKMGFVF